MEDGALHPTEEGTPQGGPASILLSNLYLNHVLDLWLEHVVKPRLKGEAYLVRYVGALWCVSNYRAEALHVQDVLRKRLGKFGLELEPMNTELVEFGRVALRDASKRGRKRPKTIYLQGFPL